MGRLGQPHPIHIGQPLLPILEAHIRPSWATILVHVGCPTSSILGTHTYPDWASNFVHIGSPSTSTLGNHVCPCWESTPVHNGRPNPPKLEAQLRPCWATTFVHVGSPHLPTMDSQNHPSWKPNSVHVGSPLLPTMDSQTHPSWKPNPCEWTTKMPPILDAQSLCVDARSCRRLEAHPERWTPIIARGHATLPELRMPTLWIVEAHFLRWPRNLYASGCPIRNVADHPDLWMPIVARGHAKRNAWTRVDADGRPYLCVGTRMERAKKIPTPLWGVRLTNFVCRLFLLTLCKVYDFDTEPKAQKQNCGFNHKIFDFIGFVNPLPYGEGVKISVGLTLRVKPWQLLSCYHACHHACHCHHRQLSSPSGKRLSLPWAAPSEQRLRLRLAP